MISFLKFVRDFESLDSCFIQTERSGCGRTSYYLDFTTNMLFLRGASPILAIFAFIELQRMCDSARFTKTPDNPTFLVKGVNTTQASLIWEYELDVGEERNSITFSRAKEGALEVENLLYKGKDTSPNIPNPFKGRVELVQPATLKIRNVEESDEGKYLCDVGLEGKASLKGIGVELKVLVLPTITRYDNKKRAELNENVTLSCNATGKPFPTIRWEKVGDSNKNFTQGYLLHLTNIKMEDAGAYRCIANNGLGEEANATTLVEVNCRNDECQIIDDVVIKMNLGWDSAYTNVASSKAKDLASYLLGEIWGVYTKDQGRDKKLRQASLIQFREGSVFAEVQLVFRNGVSNPLDPLKSEVRSGKLGTIPVERELIQITTTTPSSSTTTDASGGQIQTGARKSGLSEEAKWGIIGACIAMALIVIVILIICCCCRQKKNQQKDGIHSSFLSTKRSDLGGASPAYAQASAFRQPYNNSSSQEPARDGNLSYSQVSYTHAEPPQKPPHYPPPNAPPEYEDATLGRQQERTSDKEKEAGFELWC